jgi:hypothetical protein
MRSMALLLSRFEQREEASDERVSAAQGKGDSLWENSCDLVPWKLVGSTDPARQKSFVQTQEGFEQRLAGSESIKALFIYPQPFGPMPMCQRFGGQQHLPFGGWGSPGKG